MDHDKDHYLLCRVQISVFQDAACLEVQCVSHNHDFDGKLYEQWGSRAVRTLAIGVGANLMWGSVMECSS